MTRVPSLHAVFSSNAYSSQRFRTTGQWRATQGCGTVSSGRRPGAPGPPREAGDDPARGSIRRRLHHLSRGPHGHPRRHRRHPQGRGGPGDRGHPGGEKPRRNLPGSVARVHRGPPGSGPGRTWYSYGLGREEESQGFGLLGDVATEAASADIACLQQHARDPIQTTCKWPRFKREASTFLPGPGLSCPLCSGRPKTSRVVGTTLLEDKGWITSTGKTSCFWFRCCEGSGR
jgi:hypothetical protein